VRLAAKFSHLPILEKLITAGDVLKGYNDVSSTPLVLAARNGFYDVVACPVEKLEGLLAGGGDSETTTAEQEGEEFLRSCVDEGFRKPSTRDTLRSPNSWHRNRSEIPTGTGPTSSRRSGRAVLKFSRLSVTQDFPSILNPGITALLTPR
jgi:hypothetical protein